MDPQVDEQRQQAWTLHLAGQLESALRHQIALVNAAVRCQHVQAQDYHRLGVMFFTLRHFAGATSAFAKVQQMDPSYPYVAQNLGLSLIRSGQVAAALPPLLQAVQQDPDNLDILAGLADAYTKLGDAPTGQDYGKRILLIKDQHAQAPIHTLRLTSIPPLQLEDPARNIIAFSLFGTHPMYLEGAITNATIAKGLYPGWRCRFYCDDTVPTATRAALVKTGSQVILMPRAQRLADGLFWRFYVMEDPDVTRFLIRDCDSLLTIRERRAVDEWLASDRPFHIMRDHPSHVDLILAGLWGGLTGVLPTLTQLLKGFSYNSATQSRHADQLFLGRVVWPLIKDYCLIHDSVYTMFGSYPFPLGADLPPHRHVGDTDAAFQNTSTDFH